MAHVQPVTPEMEGLVLKCTLAMISRVIQEYNVKIPLPVPDVVHVLKDIKEMVEPALEYTPVENNLVILEFNAKTQRTVLDVVLALLVTAATVNRAIACTLAN